MKQHTLSTRLCFLLFIYLALLGVGCQNNTNSHDTASPPQVLLVDGYYIPIFPTPEEQLSYTRSWFKDNREKLSALRAVRLIFPDAHLQGGMARLDLIYNQLGEDYRLSDQKTLEKVTELYLNVIEEYAGTPQILAKAHWYLGWLKCDLMNKSNEGIAHYELLITTFPKVERNLAPPIQWISILSGNHEGTPASPPAPTIPWSHLAVLEIIRHAQSDDRAWQAFLTLPAKETQTIIKAMAVKSLLERPNPPPRVIQKATSLLESETLYPELQNDLQSLLQQLTARSPKSLKEKDQ